MLNWLIKLLLLLGIDSLEKAWKNLLPIVNDYENKLSELKGKLYNADDLKDESLKKKAELDSLKNRGHELEDQISEVSKLLDEITENKNKMEAEKEIYDAQVNKLEIEENSLKKLEDDKKLVQENLDKIREAELEVERLEKYVSKLDIYLDFEKSVNSIQRLKDEEKEINEKLDSISEQKQIVEDKKEGYNNFLSSDEEITKLTNQKSNFEKELAAMAKLEKDRKELILEIEDQRNEINNFFLKSKDKLDANGLNQDVLAEIDDFDHLEKATNDFLDKVSLKIKDIGNDVISKNEEIVGFKQNIKSCEKPLAELDGIDNKCPVCQSEIDSLKKRDLIKQYKGEIKSYENSIKKVEEDVRLLTKNKKSFEDKHERLLELSKNINRRRVRKLNTSWPALCVCITRYPAMCEYVAHKLYEQFVPCADFGIGYVCGIVFHDGSLHHQRRNDRNCLLQSFVPQPANVLNIQTIFVLIVGYPKCLPTIKLREW